MHFLNCFSKSILLQSWPENKGSEKNAHMRKKRVNLLIFIQADIISLKHFWRN